MGAYTSLEGSLGFCCGSKVNNNTAIMFGDFLLFDIKQKVYKLI